MLRRDCFFFSLQIYNENNIIMEIESIFSGSISFFHSFFSIFSSSTSAIQKVKSRSPFAIFTLHVVVDCVDDGCLNVSCKIGTLILGSLLL